MARVNLLNEKLYPASFRGVKFLVTAESVTRGQKIAIHDFPNSDRRFVEPLGKLPPLFELTCIIHGENALTNRYEFERVLDIEGISELTHPIYGKLNVQVGEYKVTSRQTELGRFVFDVPFYTSEIVIPSPAEPDGKSVSSQADIALENIAARLEDQYINPVSVLEQESSASDIFSALDSVNSAIREITDPIQSGIATVTGNIARITNGAYSIIQNATQLRDSFANLYNDIRNLSSLPDRLTNAFNSLLNFGGREEPEETTVSRSNRANNSASMTNYMRLAALACYMESIANTDFTNDQDLINANEIIDETFNSQFKSSTNDYTTDIDIRNSFQQLRIYTKNALDNQRSNIWRIVDIDAEVSSMSLINYRYFGNLDNIDTIINLNPDINNALFKESIKSITK